MYKLIILITSDNHMVLSETEFTLLSLAEAAEQDVYRKLHSAKVLIKTTIMKTQAT